MIKFKSGFIITKKELERKTLGELYSIHQDLVMSYGYGGGSNELDKLESYIDNRILDLIDTVDNIKDAN